MIVKTTQSLAAHKVLGNNTSSLNLLIKLVAILIVCNCAGSALESRD